MGSHLSSNKPLPRHIEQHGISIERISKNAISVVEGLRARGYDSYLVGGCVRDLSLGLEPKDFDVATNATPEEVSDIFPKTRLIGRRFRITHVRNRGETIEVSTFRRNIDLDDLSDVELDHESKNGIIVRDNVYGSIDEDVLRRDFTINALYYDPDENVVLDFVDGFEDIKRRKIKTIGEPEKRFREDPVRILRAIRFAAKLDFQFDLETEGALTPLSEFLTAIPPARLLDEFTKLFMHGSAAASFELLCRFDLAEILFPLPLQSLPLVSSALKNTDRRILEGKPVTPAFLLAALLWEEYQRKCDVTATGGDPHDGQYQAAHAVINEQQHTIAIPKRFAMFIKEVWQLQPRLEKRSPRSLHRLLSHRRFRAGYDFLLLRANNGNADAEVANWWTEIQNLDPDQKVAQIRKLSPRRRRRRKPKINGDACAQQQ